MKYKKYTTEELDEFIESNGMELPSDNLLKGIEECEEVNMQFDGAIWTIRIRHHDEQ